MEPIVLVHGGAGEIPENRVQPKLKDCQAAAKAGYNVLKNGGSALDAVEAAVRIMEDSEAFNAGVFHNLQFSFYRIRLKISYYFYVF